MHEVFLIPKFLFRSSTFVNSFTNIQENISQLGHFYLLHAMSQGKDSYETKKPRAHCDNSSTGGIYIKWSVVLTNVICGVIKRDEERNIKNTLLSDSQRSLNVIRLVLIVCPYL